MEGEVKVNKLMERDINIKILSILFAVLLWVYVINISNPIDVKIVSVPLKVINENTLQQKELFIKNKDYQSNVVVTVRGRKQQLENINEGSFQTAVLDLSEITGPGDVQLYSLR